MNHPREFIVIVDFGSQYVQLIARRVREQKVFSEIVQPTVSYEQILRPGLKGIILSGGPASVYAPDAPACDRRIFEAGVPILGICYGMQIGCKLLGANIASAPAREYGRTLLTVLNHDDLFTGLPDQMSVWMSHGDQVQQLNGDFVPLAKTPSCPFAAVRHKKRPFWGVQFHPEVTHTPRGQEMIRNFLYGICGCSGDWQVSDFVEEAVHAIRRKVLVRRGGFRRNGNPCA